LNWKLKIFLEDYLAMKAMVFLNYIFILLMTWKKLQGMKIGNGVRFGQY